MESSYYTGLRRNELNQLRWGDMHLEGPEPFVLAPASITKNRKEAKQFMPENLAAAVRSLRPLDAAPFQWVFHGHVPRVTTLKKDLARAGILFEIEGKRVDFHALRTSLATALMSNGESPYVVMRIMRHSDIRLTMKHYADSSKLDVQAALGRISGECAGLRAVKIDVS